MSAQKTVNALTPSIPAFEVTPDVISDGAIIRLGPGEVFWELDSKKVELNAFTGKIATKIKRHSLSEDEIYNVLNGIRTGRIIVVDKMEQGKPVSTLWLTSEYAPRARRLLDHTDTQFPEAVKNLYSLRVLETALEIEKEDKNRNDRIILLTAKIAAMKKE